MGRQPSNDVVVTEAGVSRSHAEIVESGGVYHLRDLASTNGTFVNSERISEEDHLLQDGDKIRLGASKASYVFRNPTAKTLKLTLSQMPAEDVADDPAATQKAKLPTKSSDQTPPPPESAVPAATSHKPTEGADGEDMYEGTVQLSLQAEGNMALVVNFVQQLRERPEFRLLRMVNNRRGGTDIWLGLREPISLRQMLSQVEGVAQVSPTRHRDLSPASEDSPLTVVLKAEGLPL